MNEHQRMQYLDAMGIDAFVPRLVLPAAKVSDQLIVPKVEQQAPVGGVEDLGRAVGLSSITGAEPQTAQVAEPHIQSRSAGGPQRVSINIDSVLSGSDSAESKAQENSAETAKESESTKDRAPNEEVTLASLARGDAQKAAADQVRFSLSLWRVGDWQVIDSRRPGDALPTDRLLGNMLQSLGVLDVNLPRAEMLQWPMVENKANQGWAEARAMVQGFLDGRLLAQPVSHFILMGQDANHAVLGEEFDYLENQFAEQEVSDFNAKAIVLPSLSDLLYAQHLKRDTWLALQSIVS